MSPTFSSLSLADSDQDTPRICGNEEPILDVEPKSLDNDFPARQKQKSRLKSSGIESARELLSDPVFHAILTLAKIEWYGSLAEVLDLN